MINDTLRKQVKILKATQNISYLEFAEFLEMKKNSFYNWLNGQYELSPKTTKRLQEIIDILREE